jgi:multidrug efflux pump subunit AcrA (membrane-fusion protein)
MKMTVYGRRLWALVLLIFFLPVGSSAQEALVVKRAQREVTLTGYTRAKATVDLSAEVSGKIVERNYDIGQVVGDAPLFVIDTTFIDFQIESTRHTLEQLQVALQMKRSRMAFLKKEFERIRELHQRNSTAGSKRDSAEEEYAQARFESDSTAVQMAQAETSLAELEERRRRHWIYAPRGWRVTGSLAETGEIVRINSPIATVGDYRTLVVPLAVSADEFTALLRLDPSIDAILEGRAVNTAVLRVDPQFDEKTRKIKLDLEIHGYNGDHRGGLRLTLPLTVSEEGLQVPKAAVINRYENPRVKIKATGKEVAILVLGEANDHLTIGDNRQLSPGIELAAP